MSISTARGWWKAPIRFLPCGELIPVLPPTALSTWARSVVGIWMKSMPRSVTAAAKPDQVADHAAAQGDHDRAPLDAEGQQLVDQLLEERQLLVPSPAGSDDPAAGDAGRAPAPPPAGPGARSRARFSSVTTTVRAQRQQRRQQLVGALDQPGADGDR